MTRLTIRRRRALRISRGVSGTTENLFVEVRAGGIAGIGEAAPVGYRDPQDAESAEREIGAAAPSLASLQPCQMSAVEALLKEGGVRSAARAAINIACYDWLGKRAGLPVYRLLGLEPKAPPTSVTVGINTPEVVAEETARILAETGGRVLKVKLGGEGGIEADKERFLAARGAVPDGAALRVDANGAWGVSDAVLMIAWLAEQGCEYVEQPISHEADDELPHIYEKRRLPILLDESVWTAHDAARLGRLCDGVNVKLMKCGGISEALRIVHTVKAMGLKTMIGCFGESSLAISAGAAISALFDYVDLDSHLNLDPDPAEGAEMVDGGPRPRDLPGIGVRMR
ncbi:MAG: dipeptide epimerase [Armatimonadetes bacterium]|nr:dipeptide epimerase [Armatimonadota bacterium]